MTVLLDPWSLTWPASEFSEEVAEEYVERLTRLFALSREEVLPLCVSDECVELLLGDDAYPLVEQLPKPLWPNRSDIYRLVASLLEKLPKFERLGIAAVLVERSSAEPRMDYARTARHEAHLHELSVVALVAAERSSIPLPSILSASVAASRSHEFSSIVADVECIAPPEARVGAYDGVIHVRPSIAHCVLDWSPADLLMYGYIAEAVAIAAWAASGAQGWNPFEVSGWRVGREFVRSIGDSGVTQNRSRVEALLRACGNVVAGINLRATHALRVNASGGSPQITRSSDGATAWRADVDDEFHLHYWSGGGVIEFSNVVVHNDFGISQ